MRILHVVNHTRRQNGNVHAAVDLACAQSELGHEVTLCSGGGDFEPLLRANRVAVETLPDLLAKGRLLQACRALRALAAARDADIVHAHMMRSAGLAWAATRFSHARLVTTVHNAFEKSAILMGVGDRVVAVSEAVGVGMRRRGIPAGRLRVVLNGTLGNARHRHEPPPKPLTLEYPAVLSVGGLHPRKGVLDLLAGFSQARRARPELHLYLVGGGPCAAEYRAAVAAADAGHVHFCGSHADPRPYMLGADVFVLASHADPAPLVIPEAREAGLAIIATRVDGVPELLEGGAAGVLVAPQAPAEIAAALLAVLADARSLADHRARSQINLRRLSVQRVAAETLAVYDEVLRPRARRARPSPIGRETVRNGQAPT
ncbi:glycosyltransferase family 4 protein [Phenylobacterium sp. LjRoot219]|uniref:glycosyltransferase family 4 protein n=1 Tax=Phenylobacterium sp. LjRoot219 TaxID=3342283 RepID=UPI003ECCB632